MESIISRWREKRAKERAKVAPDPVEGEPGSVGSSSAGAMAFHILGFIAAALVTIPFGERGVWPVAARTGAIALVWIVAWPALRFAARERSRSARTVAVEQLLIVLPALLTVAVATLAFGYAPLRDFLNSLPLMKNVPMSEARLMLADSAPVSLAALAAVLLFGRGTCAVVGAMSAMMMAICSDFRLQPLAMGFAATMIFMHRGRRVSSRSKARRLSFRAAVALCAVTLVFIATHKPFSWDAAIVRVIGAAVSAIAGALVSLALLPLLESLSGAYSNITLNSFADLEHPLLRDLRYKASGTFAHSDRVSLLASAAAEAIGADVILARVIGYYHDIGKLAKPEYFTENSNGGPNPHDTLSPNVSRMIIASHIKEGVVIGRKYHLPPPVLDAIHQHHGNSIMRSFYGKALRQDPQMDLPGMTQSETVDPNSFRYDSKRPSTREIAILMLADIAEAALRSMPGLSKEDVPAKIDSLIASVIADGQLDDCPLKFSELRDIRKALAVTYIGISHTRVAYPDQNSDNKVQNTDQKQS